MSFFLQVVFKLINTFRDILNVTSPSIIHIGTQTLKACLFLLMVISWVMMTELRLWLTYWWLMAMLSDSCQPP